MQFIRFVYLLVICSQFSCSYLPPSLSSIYSQSETSSLPQHQKPDPTVSIEIAEEIANRIYSKYADTDLQTNSRNFSASFKVDTDTAKTLEMLLEHAMRHVAVLIPHPAIKTAYEKFIDFFPPGTIGGSITIIGKELLALLWACMKKRRATSVTGQQ